MSSALTPRPTDRAATERSSPEWDVWNWPLIDNVWQSVPVALGTLGVGVLASRMSHSVAMGMLASFVLIAAMWRYWLPIRYHFRRRGIVVHCLGSERLIPWSTIEQYRLRKRGVVLLFRRKDLWFDGFGAKFIDGRDQQDRLVAAIEFFQRSSSVLKSHDKPSQPSSLDSHSLPQPIDGRVD